MSLPQHMRADDPAAADPARRRIHQNSPFIRFPSLASPTSSFSLNTIPPPSSDQPTADILIDGAHLPHLSDDTDEYRWAILYENQRGITLFSKPLYSPLSLFPSDPEPFTMPDNHTRRGRRRNLSLQNYPLPDGTWRWVSSAWMIDMRTDRGEVQHDGFEYNWSFRANNWHAQIGKLSASAWVRRRRWVRLMMRPANHTRVHYDRPSTSLPNPSSVDSDHHTSHTWDGGDQDWQHVRRLLKQLGRDGRKLELWHLWLGPHAQTPDKGKAKQPGPLVPPSLGPLEKRLSDVIPEGNVPPLAHLTAILRNHGEAVLHSFVFPDSRAEFVELVRRAGLAKDLESCLGHAFSLADIDFWSYADKLDERNSNGSLDLRSELDTRKVMYCK